MKHSVRQQQFDKIVSIIVHNGGSATLQQIRRKAGRRYNEAGGTAALQKVLGNMVLQGILSVRIDQTAKGRLIHVYSRYNGNDDSNSSGCVNPTRNDCDNDLRISGSHNFNITIHKGRS